MPVIQNDGEEASPLPAWNDIYHLCSLRTIMVALLTGLFSMYMISLTATRRADGNQTFHFEYVTVTLTQEVLKLSLAFLCLKHSTWASGDKASRWGKCLAGAKGSNIIELKNDFKFRTFLKYGVPGLLYSFDNNFQYVILGFLQPAELAVLWNFKIFATVVLLHIFLGRRYTRNQWAAMLVLVFGCALTQVPYHPWTARRVPLIPAAGSAELPHHLYVSTLQGPEATPRWSRKIIGALLSVVGSTIAASSNVYCEWLVKQHPQDSIHFQMVQLYSFGVVLNAVTLAVKAALDPDSPVHHQGGFFAGYDSWVLTIIFFGTASGMAISAALKHMDNIAVIFAHALAVLVVAAVSAEYFGLSLSVPFLIGVLLVLASLVVFHHAEGNSSGEDLCDGPMETAPLRKGCLPAAERCATRPACEAAARLTHQASGGEEPRMYCLT